MSAPHIAVVMPVIETEDRHYWHQAIRSVYGQTYPSDRISLIQVIRYASRMPETVTVADTPKPVVLGFPMNKDAPVSDIHQFAVGFDHARRRLQADYVMLTAANDLMGNTMIQDAVRALESDPRRMVAYCDYMMCDREMHPKQAVKLEDTIDLRVMKRRNCVPDHAMFRASLLETIPYDSSFKRVSMWVWWMKILRAHGSEAFVHIRKPNFLYRQHRSQTSQDWEYVNEGNRIMTEWLRSEGLIGEDRKIVQNMAVFEHDGAIRPLPNVSPQELSTKPFSFAK